MAVRRFMKNAAVPFAWAISNRSSTVEQTVDPEHQAEVRQKLSNLVKAPWFQPPFGGAAFTRLLLDAFQAMASAPAGPPLLPDYQPLDLFVTVTDFRGHPQRLRLNSPPEVIEQEHRLTLAFRDPGGESRRLADPAELVFAGRATASFPGAFPPFQVTELDAVLAERGQHWHGRDAFLERNIPARPYAESRDQVVLIDGGVQAHAPFGPCMEALRSRPASREVDRRFVYIDPAPGFRAVRWTATGTVEPPGFWATLFGAMSDIPREQPIRDNLDVIERRSERIRRMRRIVESMRGEVEAAIEGAFGKTFFLTSPTPRRLQAWRAQANELAARGSGYTFAAYAQLKIATVIEEMAGTIARLGGDGSGREQRIRVRDALWRWAEEQGITGEGAVQNCRAAPELIGFFRSFDASFRIRRLRLLARELAEAHFDIEEVDEVASDNARQAIYRLIARYEAPLTADMDAALTAAEASTFANADKDAATAVAALEARLRLKELDDFTDEEIATALSALSRGPRRAAILNYLGYPFYDVATLPLLQGEGLQEFDPMKVDRISPDDATTIRAGTAATLKGIQFNNFGAFFSRAYRENDYLWGRLHGADRLIDIIVSTIPGETPLATDVVARMKREAFLAILDEERSRLSAIPGLFEELAAEIG
jgi:patatin-related protein